GRTHQIRVHCRAIGHPLIGDTLYSDIPTTRIDRQALHSQSLRFLHPITGRETKIVSSLPKDMLALLESLNTKPMGEG
ncbi:MAG TPA: RluA family pseudouridine synthase, partial [Clostridiales bacterium]|nr:RluA family pseudouridine synthase [Clostridiales bacterium]